MIGDEAKWRKVTVEQARLEQQEGTFTFWRPGMETASRENPDLDIALVLDELQEIKPKRIKIVK